MGTEIQHHADFSRIRYGQCWEDADVLATALRASDGRRCLSIGSAGDNAFGLLAAGAAHVTCVEMNPAQCACIDLRRAAYLELDHGALLELLGLSKSDRRPQLFDACAPRMDPESVRFWKSLPDWTAIGAVHQGKFERYFALFRTRVLPLAHPRPRVEQLLTPRRPADRERFYEERWNNLRWRLLFKIFFSRAVMGRLGRDPAFFRHVKGSVAERILARTRHALVSLDPAANPYLTFILTGTFRDHLPLALRPESHSAIRSALLADRFKLVRSTLEAELANSSEAAYDAFNLSDIFEYMSIPATDSLFDAISNRARRGARLAYWNMLCPRERPAALAHRIRHLESESESLFQQDRAFFYSRFLVDEIV